MAGSIVTIVLASILGFLSLISVSWFGHSEWKKAGKLGLGSVFIATAWILSFGHIIIIGLCKT